MSLIHIAILFSLFTFGNVFLCSPTHAQEAANPTAQEPTATEKINAVADETLNAPQESIEKKAEDPDTTRKLRESSNHSLVLTYSPYETWIPSKLGLSYAHVTSAQSTWELEYMKGSVSAPYMIDDLGRLVEQRLSINMRSYSQRNSLNFTYGLNYTSLKVELGNKYLSAISGGSVGLYDLVTIESLGFNWGIGSRWQFKNKMLLGVDWFEIHIPAYILKSDAPFLTANATAEEIDDVRTTINIIERIPTFAMLKLQIGLTY